MAALWKVVFRRSRNFRGNLMTVMAFIFFTCSASVALTYFFLTGSADAHLRHGVPNSYKSVVDVLHSGELHNRELNLVRGSISNSSAISIHGWWMPHARWRAEVECLNKPWGVCTQVFTVNCKAGSIRSVYQYIPIKPSAKINNIYFAARGAAESLEKNPLVMDHEAVFSAVALVQLQSGAKHKLRLDFPAGNHDYQLSQIDMWFPSNITSVIIMLCCSGYVGRVKVTDITLKPIYENGAKPTGSSIDIIEKCPVTPLNPRQLNLSTVLMHPDQNIKGEHLVTLVTQASMDRIDVLENTLRHWEGPVSIAIYITASSSVNNKDKDWQQYYIRKKLHGKKLGYRSEIILVYASSPSDPYPINYMRNLAIRQVRTKYMLLLDADFHTSPHFQENVQRALLNLRRERGSQENTAALVVPAFEYLEETYSVPETKEALVEQILMENTNIVPFKNEESPEAHRATDYSRWYKRQAAFPLTMYTDKYEPYIILRNNKDVPLYDERFVGYGMNKVTHTMELKAAGYEFFVLPNVWAIHVPHRTTASNINFLQDPFMRLENRAKRFEFVADLMKKYQLGECTTR